MDPVKRDILLEQCDVMKMRLEVAGALLECRRDAGPLSTQHSALRTPLQIIEKLQADLSFLRKNIESEPLTFSLPAEGRVPRVPNLQP